MPICWWFGQVGMASWLWQQVQADPGIDKAGDLGVGQVTRGDGGAGLSGGILAGHLGSVQSGTSADAGTTPAGQPASTTIIIIIIADGT
jgi:hypothetical protein